jgi:hypothetical protein
MRRCLPEDTVICFGVFHLNLIQILLRRSNLL